MNTELPKEVPYGQRAKVGDAPKTDARLESPPLETNTTLLKDSICTLATNTGMEFLDEKYDQIPNLKKCLKSNTNT